MGDMKVNLVEEEVGQRANEAPQAPPTPRRVLTHCTQCKICYGSQNTSKKIQRPPGGG